MPFDPVLAQALKFTEEDFNANFYGLLSPNQQERVRLFRHAEFHLGLPLRVYLVGVFTLGMCLLGLLIQHKAKPKSSIAEDFLIVIAIIISAIGYVTVTTINNLNEIKNLKLQHIEGPVHHLKREPRQLWYVSIHNERFWVDQKDYDAFKEGALYRVYYFPNSNGEHSLLTAERIDAVSVGSFQKDKK